MIDIEFDTAEIERQMERVRHIKYAVQKVLYPAVSEVMDNSRAYLSRHLIAEIPLPDRVIARSVRRALVRSTDGGQAVIGRVGVASKAIPLIHYDVQPAEVTARKGLRNIFWPGFTFSLRGGVRRQRERLENQGLPFIASMHNEGKGGHLGVYRKTPAGQIKELYGPPVQYHATTPELEAGLMAQADADMLRILPLMVEHALAQEAGL